MEKVAQAIDLSKDVCSFRYGHTGLKEILDGTYYFNLLLKRDVSVARVHKLILHLLPALEIEIKCSELDCHLEICTSSYDKNAQNKIIEIAAMARLTNWLNRDIAISSFSEEIKSCSSFSGLTNPTAIQFVPYRAGDRN